MQALRVLQQYAVPVEVQQLDEMPNGAQLQGILKTSITQYPAFSSTGKLNASLGHTIRHCSLFLLSTPAFFCGFSLDRTIAHGTDLLVGCQHRCTNPAEAKALPHEGASALVILSYLHQQSARQQCCTLISQTRSNCTRFTPALAVTS